MTTQDQIDRIAGDIPAQVAALREQVEQLVSRSGAVASQAAQNATQAAVGEVDTIRAQFRDQPVATLLVASMGALVGYALARISRH